MALKKKRVMTPKAKNIEPDFTGCETWSGEQFHRTKNHAYEVYRLEFKNSDYKQWVLDYIVGTNFEEHLDKLKKLPEHRFSSTLGGLCRMIKHGKMPDTHEAYTKHWESLPGTIGTPKPSSEYINTSIQGLIDLNEEPAPEEKNEDIEDTDKKEETYRPSIQQRIWEQSCIISEFIEQAFDDFTAGKIVDFKSVSLLKHLRQTNCKMPHARLIKAFYAPQKDELSELLFPPDTKKMNEHELDMHNQLKEGYSHIDKKTMKKLFDFFVQIDNACDGIIAESKANRKPRKMSKKAPEVIVKKLKYKVTDEKFGVTSIEAHKIISANCLVVFNCKTRKLGVYYTSVEDPTGAGRDGSGLDVKGTTIQRYNEEKSIWKTLRKPDEQLREVKNLNTRRKFENWFEGIKTTPVKMNGRINPETVLIGVY
jgi:hypothetical protein